MTNYHDSTIDSRFDAALSNYEAANAAAASVNPLTSCAVTDRILTILDNAADALFNTPAPTLGAIAIKLEKYWGETLCSGYDQAAFWRQLLTGDIRRAERLRAGVQEPDATGGMDMTLVAIDWTSALREFSRYELVLHEGPSAWGQSTHDDILDLRDQAQARLLSTRAPHLDAVITKLEVLWADGRFDMIEESSGHVLILRDLRRLARSQ